MQPTTPSGPRDRVVQLIREAADRHGISRRVALSFAWCESRFNPAAEGDLIWHERHAGALYRKHVLHNPRLQSNPDRLTPEVWHSYGLFQLLAPYHVQPLERPAVLLDPVINADRGCAAIALHLAKAQGDVLAARFSYVGGGVAGSRLSPPQRQIVREQLQRALEQFAGEET